MSTTQKVKPSKRRGRPPRKPAPTAEEIGQQLLERAKAMEAEARSLRYVGEVLRGRVKP